MAWIAERSPAAWRSSLRTASYKGAPFHVETGGKASGRRVALHEYPKRDLPYAEDMGRRAIRYDIVGYLIQGDRKLGMDYRISRDVLIAKLESETGGLLVMPSLSPLTVICEQYSVSESRERGGYCTFEMRFVEVGSPANVAAVFNTQTVGQQAVTNSNNASQQAFNNQMSFWGLS